MDRKTLALAAAAILALGALAAWLVAREPRSAGGPGANFLIGWAGPPDVDAPLMEAVMGGRSGNAGISFTSPGRTVSNPP